MFKAQYMTLLPQYSIMRSRTIPPQYFTTSLHPLLYDGRKISSIARKYAELIFGTITIITCLRCLSSKCHVPGSTVGVIKGKASHFLVGLLTELIQYAHHCRPHQISIVAMPPISGLSWSAYSKATWKYSFPTGFAIGTPTEPGAWRAGAT